MANDNRPPLIHPTRLDPATLAPLITLSEQTLAGYEAETVTEYVTRQGAQFTRLRAALELEIEAQRQRSAEQAATIARLEQELENERMRLVACDVAALQNTPATVADRIGPSHSYYSAAYGAVCRAVDREMAQRTRVEQLETALASARRRSRP